MDRSNVSLTFTVKDPETADVLHETKLEYNDLPYRMLVEMQKILVKAGGELTKLGEAAAKAKAKK